MAALSRCLAFSPELTPEEMMDGFPSKKDDRSDFTDADYVACMRSSWVLESTLVNETDLTPYQAVYDAEGKWMRSPPFKEKNLVPARRKPLFAPDLDPSPLFNEAEFEALLNCNWDVDNLQIEENED